MSSKENYGWYSKKQHLNLSKGVKNDWISLSCNSKNTQQKERKHNSYIYQTEGGDTVLCTEVTRSSDHPTGRYDDFVFKGKLVKFIKSCYTEVQD